MKPRQTPWFVLLLIAVFTSIPFAGAREGLPPKSLSAVSSGLPSLARGPLDRQSFVPVKARRLAHPKLLLLDLDALREKGVAVPPEGATPEFVQEVLDAWAWGVPSAQDDPSMFTSETKTFYADKYGGSGMGDNLGSARAMSAGEFQVKGGGITPLLEEKPAVKPEDVKGLKKKFDVWWDNYHHGNGKMPITESEIEYTWGKVLDRELPYGANRVLAVIATGGKVIGPSMLKEPAVIVIRENSVRPAHFIRNYAALEKNEAAETARVQKLDRKLEEALPKPKNWKAPVSRAGRIADQVGELIDRVGNVFGTEYGLSFYHGSTSPSNIEINGKALDHSTMSAVGGFAKVKFVDDTPSGNTAAYRETMLYEFVDDLKETLPKKDARLLPSHQEIATRLNQSFNRAIKRTFLWLSGTPEEFLEDATSSAAGNDLAVTLRKIARDGNDEVVNGRQLVPADHGTYDFDAILQALGADPSQEDPSALRSLIPDEGLRSELVARYSSYLRFLKAKAESLGMSDGALETYIRYATRVRARPMPQLTRNLETTLSVYSAAAKYILGGDQAIAHRVRQVVSRSERHFKNLLPFEVVTSEKHDFQTGLTVRKVFDMRSDTNQVLVQAPIEGQQVDFFGKMGALSELSKGNITLTDSRGNVFRGTAARARNHRREVLTYEVPDVPPDFDLDSTRIQLEAGPDFLPSKFEVTVQSVADGFRKVESTGLYNSPCDLLLLRLH